MAKYADGLAGNEVKIHLIVKKYNLTDNLGASFVIFMIVFI
jgi:hypothetical protein